MLSDKGQGSVRQVDQVFIKESQDVIKHLWSYDIKEIMPLVEEEDEEEENNGINEEKAQRQIGVFIQHEDFNPDALGSEVPEEMYKDLDDIQKVFVMDHDFVCLQKQRNEEFENMYMKGLESYIQGDWMQAQQAFNFCLDLMKDDGPLDHMLKLMDKTKAIPPELWNGGLNWDLKAVPPEIDFLDLNDEDESGGSEENK